MTRRRVLAIVGPTAVGKSALALHLASLLPIEIISADARQVFRMLDIGTAKPTREEQSICPHHCIDILEPDASYSAAEYAADARTAIASVAEDRLAVVVGGSGLYLRAALDGLSHDVVPPEPSVRDALQERLVIEGRDALFEELEHKDPRAAERYADRNPVRVLRALEFIHTTGRPFSSTWDTVVEPPPFDVTWVGLHMDRPRLYSVINDRCLRMWSAGLVDETAAVLARGISAHVQSLQTVGYTEALAVLRGAMDVADAQRTMQQATRNYAKRQLTWFRRDDRITWFDAQAPDLLLQVAQHLDVP